MGSRILLADDSITIQKVVNLTFVDEGIDVVTVSNGEMAQRRLAEVNPDLVLADIFMPGKNGYELCQFVKDSPQFKDVPVVLLVGAFEPFDQAEARRVKADGHLTKPFESRTLVETVRNLIQSSKALRPAPPPPLVAVAPEPTEPAVDLSELVDGVWAVPGAPLSAKATQASEAAPITRPLEAPFDLTVAPSAEDLFAASPAQGNGEAWPTSTAQPLELSGIGEAVEPTEPAQFDVSHSELNLSPTAEEQEIAPAARVTGPLAYQAVEPEPPDPNDFRFETLFSADQPAESNGAISPGMSQQFDNPDLDFELGAPAEFSADLPQPSAKNFAFEAFDPPPSADVNQPAETKGFDFEGPASSEPAAPLAAPAIPEVSSEIGSEIGMATESGSTWQSEEPTGTGEVAGSTEGFDLYDEPGVSIPQSHPSTSSTEAYSFATDDEPFGDLLEEENSAVSASHSDFAPKELHEMPVAEVQAAAAEAFGFDLVSETPAETVAVSEFVASRARINGGQVGAAEPAMERPAEQPATDVPNVVVAASDLDQTVDVAATAFPYAAEERGFAHSLVEDTPAEVESGFTVVSEEPAVAPVDHVGHQHADFFASSFPAREQSKFTSSEMWPEINAEQAVPDTEIPPNPETEAALFSRDAGRPTDPAASWTAAAGTDNIDSSETGFEFSQLIDEINEMDATLVAEPIHAPVHSSDPEPVAPASDAAEHSEVTMTAHQPFVVEPLDSPRLEAVTANPAERSNGDFSGLSPTTIEEIVRSVVREMSDAVVREIAWEIVPECVERVVERLSREGAAKRVIG
jgi:CheY-like chemotaxis protein